MHHIGEKKLKKKKREIVKDLGKDTGRSETNRAVVRKSRGNEWEGEGREREREMVRRIRGKTP